MATFQPVFGSWTDFTIGLDVTPLASSSDHTLGRESASVDNTSTLFEDFEVSGFITVGTTPTVDTTIEVWVYTNVNDLTTFPDVLDGTDSDETITTAAIKRAALHLAAVLAVDTTTSDRNYWMRGFSLAQVLGFVPEKWGLFVTHNTGVTLNTTAANHKLSYRGVNGQSI